MRLLLLGIALALSGAVAGCSNGPACVIDTDCPVGSRCAADGTCRELGVGSDAGPRDAAAPRDAPGGDARADASTSDAPVAVDAPALCPDGVAGVHPLSTIGISCSGLTQATIVLTDDGTGSCSFGVAFDAMDAGSLMGDGSGNRLAGTLMIGAASLDCAVTVDAGSLSARCGDCMFTADPAP